MGVFGAAALPPERLEEELAWIDDHIGGKPYGVDLIVPNSFAGKCEAPASGAAAIPGTHLKFAADGRVCHHCDYWDTGEELFMKLPVLGWLWRGVRRLLAAR